MQCTCHTANGRGVEVLGWRRGEAPGLGGERAYLPAVSAQAAAAKAGDAFEVGNGTGSSIGYGFEQAVAGDLTLAASFRHSDLLAQLLQLKVKRARDRLGRELSVEGALRSRPDRRRSALLGEDGLIAGFWGMQPHEVQNGGAKSLEALLAHPGEGGKILGGLRPTFGNAQHKFVVHDHIRRHTLLVG